MIFASTVMLSPIYLLLAIAIAYEVLIQRRLRQRRERASRTYAEPRSNVSVKR